MIGASVVEVRVHLFESIKFGIKEPQRTVR